MLKNFRNEISVELISILNFWENNTVDTIQGGFYGKIDHSGKIYPEAGKGGVLNSRILWAFSAAAGFDELPDEKRVRYKKLAERAFEYLKTYFIDSEFGGVYWSVTSSGKPLSTRKQIYGLSFAIYGLSEYYKISSDITALEEAQKLYELIEKYSFDAEYGGYLEAFSKEWNLMDDHRLSNKDRNHPKSMNTHLHIIEAYSNLYSVWPDILLKEKISALLDIFETLILNTESGHLNLFFDKNWKIQSNVISFGHDIEASWLLLESAEIIKDEFRVEKWKTLSLKMAEATLEGFNLDGSLNHEKDRQTGHLDTHREWWVSAEAMVGFLNAFAISGTKKYLPLVGQIWEFTKENLIDRENGEWVWGVYPPYASERNYRVMTKEDKVGFWKCPYHNTRACIEILKRYK